MWCVRCAKFGMLSCVRHGVCAKCVCAKFDVPRVMCQVRCAKFEALSLDVVRGQLRSSVRDVISSM